MPETEIIDVTPVNDPNVAALAVVEHTDALVRPAAANDQIEQAFRDYQNLSKRLLVASDYQEIQGKRFPKRSAWRKLAVAFGVTFEIVDRVHDRDDKQRILRSEFIVRAQAPNGRFSDGWGACSAFERCCDASCRRRHQHCPGKDGKDCDGRSHFSHAEHDIPATAETRAKNRAAADLFGMGEVSAEEITDRDVRREEQEAPTMTRPISEQQMKALHASAKERGFAHENLSHYAHTKYGRGSLTELTYDEASEMLDELKRLPVVDEEVQG
jgi:hypothetical protein